MTTPTRSERYQLPSWPKTTFDRDLWNTVFGDIADRLDAREGLEASFELLQQEGIQASLDYIQANVAPQIANLQVSIDLAQDQIDKIIIDGISPNSAKLGGQLPAYYATAAALASGLAARVPTARKVAGKELTSDIVLEKADVELGNVDNTKDADKPISTPQANALGKRVQVDAVQNFSAAEKGQAIANIGGGGLAGHRNKVLNPTGVINQLGVSGSVVLSAGQYGHDGMKGGAAGCTYTFSTVNGVTTYNITSGTLTQVLEASSFAGAPGSYVLGWEGTSQGRIASGPYGSSGDISAICNGSANVVVEWGVGTLSLLQFEKDYLATFSPRQKDLETVLCQAHYEQSDGTISWTQPGSASAVLQRYSYPFKVLKRVTPTVQIDTSLGSSNLIATGRSFFIVGSSGTAMQENNFRFKADARL
ncbi:hypothetical protein GAO09_00265 [Rhizobiales bacterium RZME27]|uniref:Tail fiber protein n=1 Tax=Endobacterium cereale TaxID=2663029 RepID=A0A6A8A431_9HYPH|nr:hypothetical protein [Endobacterium cereale]MQY44508.1 hypothetical protein [Endobacterium cereale]